MSDWEVEEPCEPCEFYEEPDSSESYDERSEHERDDERSEYDDDERYDDERDNERSDDEGGLKVCVVCDVGCNSDYELEDGYYCQEHFESQNDWN